MLKIKGRDMRDLALVSLGMSIDPDLKRRCLEEIEKVPKQAWYKCEFRNCDLLLLYGNSQFLEKFDLEWKVDSHSGLQELVDRAISPFFSTLPRIIVLKTSPGQEMQWHVDCNTEEIESVQPKMRVLLKGNSDDLYFMNRSGDPLKVTTVGDVYYMSGTHIHALKNNSTQDRYVFCLGSPWSETDIRSDFLKRVEEQPDHHFLWNDHLKLSERAEYVREPKKHLLVPYG